MLDGFTPSTFSPHLGSRFRVPLGAADALELELVEVKGLGTVAGPRQEPFSLLFRGGPRDRYLPQSTYRLEHAEMGSFELFLVPLGADEVAMRYEAVFN
ncbi:MAG TPA: hypothetical protein VOA87_16300 [Thermoanaerobaculia bacterium]|nr:hypothetical protein [Thermoanaerobaculia bacterium]